MKIIYFIFGMILIFSGFLSFSLIGVFNDYIWMNFTYHVILTLIGFIFIFLGIISMVVFLKQEDAKIIKNEEKTDAVEKKKEK